MRAVTEHSAPGGGTKPPCNTAGQSAHLGRQPRKRAALAEWPVSRAYALWRPFPNVQRLCADPLQQSSRTAGADPSGRQYWRAMQLAACTLRMAGLSQGFGDIGLFCWYHPTPWHALGCVILPSWLWRSLMWISLLHQDFLPPPSTTPHCTHQDLPFIRPAVACSQAFIACMHAAHTSDLAVLKLCPLLLYDYCQLLLEHC